MKSEKAAAMKIGELSEAARCPVETIRYYETEGLLPKPVRGENNYRLYGPDHLQRLVFIRNCRALDMSHEEVRTLLGLMDAPGDDCGSVNDVLDKHIAHVELRIRELRRLKVHLAELRNKCRSQSTVNDCRIIEGLSTMRAENKPSRTHV